MVSIFNKSVGLFLLCIGSFLILKNNQDLDFLRIILVLISFYLTIIIIFFPVFNSKYIGELPLIYLINLYFLTCYLGIFFLEKYKILLNYNYDLEDHIRTINTFFVGYVFFLSGYLIIKLFLKNYKRKSFVYLNCNINETLLIGSVTLLFAVFSFYILEIQNYFKFLSQLKYPLLLFGIGLSFHYIIKNKFQNKLLNIFLISLIIAPIFIELVIGSFNFPFMIILLLYSYFVVEKKKINLIPFIIICSLFFLIHIGKYDYRNQTWSKDNTKINFYERSKINLYERSKIFLNAYLFNRPKSLQYENIINKKDFITERRIFHSYWSLLIVTKATPGEVGYWNGYSYKLLFSKIIPRIFWKNKPSDILGNEFGHRYNVLIKDSDVTVIDKSTSWNMPILNEFYVNFGIFGVSAGMFLMGIIFSLFTKFFSIRENNNLEKIISFFTLIPTFFLESHLSLLFGAVIQSYLFLLFISFAFLFLIRKFL